MNHISKLENHTQKRKRNFISWKLKQEIVKRDKSHCQICGCKIDTKTFERNDFGKVRIKYHIDHIIPFHLGGTEQLLNLRLTCPDCNYGRNGKYHLEE